MEQTARVIEPELEQKALSVVDEAKTLVVGNAEQYATAGEFVAGCKALEKEIKAQFAEPKRKAHEAHKAITAMETNQLEPIKRAIQIVEATAIAWKREQDRIAAEQERKRREEAQREREAEKLKEAEILESFGDDEGAAEAMKAATMPIRQVKIESTVPKVQGLHTRKTWKARIINPGAVNREFCEPDTTRINSKVQNTMRIFGRDVSKEQIAALEAEIGGIEVYEHEGFAG